MAALRLPTDSKGKLLAACIALVSLLPLGAYAQTATVVFEHVKDSVFVVKTFDGKGTEITLGSAVLLPDGKFATNQHVVKDGKSFQVGRGEQFVAVTVYAEDSSKDIALLIIRGSDKLPPLPPGAVLDAPFTNEKPVQLGKAATLKVGQPVYAIGAPQGLELSISEGIVSQLRGGPPPFIQTTAAISPGSSGGGLFDAEGRLVGLTALYIEGGQNLNFALPVEWIADVKPGAKSLKDFAERSQGAWLARAVDLEDKKDWVGLRDWCLSWTKSEPNNAYAFCDLGEAYSRLGASSDAIEAYRLALRIEPGDGLMWDLIGVEYSILKRDTEAVDAFRQALHINVSDALAWGGIGFAYNHLERYTEQADAYRQALRINPDDALAWCGLGTAYSGLDHYGEAVEAYRHALRINPVLEEAWLKLGFAYTFLNRFTDAADAFRQALRINPDDVNALAALGLAYVWDGNKSAALDVVKTLRRLDPEKADKLFNLIVPP